MVHLTLSFARKCQLGKGGRQSCLCDRLKNFCLLCYGLYLEISNCLCLGRLQPEDAPTVGWLPHSRYRVAQCLQLPESPFERTQGALWFLLKQVEGQQYVLCQESLTTSIFTISLPNALWREKCVRERRLTQVGMPLWHQCFSWLLVPPCLSQYDRCSDNSDLGGDYEIPNRFLHFQDCLKFDCEYCVVFY